jgi:hypothetical protein
LHWFWKISSIEEKSASVFQYYQKLSQKIVDYAQGQGVDSVLKRGVHAVREHFKPNRNAAIESKMHF